MNASVTVAALGTGEGKTLVGLGLARALSKAGYAVAPFKSGPDYIDAALYAHACGVRATNVDLWLDGPQRVRESLARARTRGCAIVLEGMMGLFDGDDWGETSTAHIASANDIPVMLVVDGWRMSQSAAAAALGAAAMRPRVRVAGVILNRAGAPTHVDAVRRACETAGFPLLAALPFDASWSIPERALGLDVRAVDAAVLDDVADALARQIDLQTHFGDPQPLAPDAAFEGDGPVVAVAQDAALWFTYPQTLDALRAAGASVVPFSPLADRSLPPATRAIWLGGGYPETHAEQLSANLALRSQIVEAHASGIPIYAECGGMMYLAQSLETRTGTFPMCGILRGRCSIAHPALTIGYRELRAARDSILDRRGDTIRAYEFHYAQASMSEAVAYEGAGDCGAWRERVVAGFVHRRFFVGDSPSCRFVESLLS